MRTATQIARSATSIENIGSSITGAARSAASVIASYGVKGIVGSLLGSFEGKESTLFTLGAAITASGRNASEVVPEYEKWADSLSKVTTSAKLANLAMLKQAESMGLAGPDAQQAVQNAVALAAGMGGSAQGHLHQAIHLQQGNVGRLGMQLGLSGMHEGPEKLAAAQAKLTKMFQVARAESNTYAGAVKKLTNEWTLLKAEMGETIASAMKPAINYTRQLVEWFLTLDKQTKETIAIVLMVASSFVTLFSGMKTGLYLLGLMGSGTGLLLVAIAAAGYALSSWVKSVGGIGNAWAIVQEKALRVWDYTRYYWQQFISWAQPKWESFVNWAGNKWNYIKDVASNVLDYFGPTFEKLGIEALLFSSVAIASFELISKAAQYAFGLIPSVSSEAMSWIIAMVPPILLVGGAIYLLIAAWKFLHITQLINIGIWLVWKGAVLAASIVIGVWSVSLFVAKAAMWLLVASFSASTVAAGAWAGAMALAKSIVILFTGALTVANVALGATYLLAGAIAVGVLYAGFKALWSIVTDTASGVAYLGRTIQGMSVGPVTHITGLFSQWGGIIGTVIAAFKDDMPGAIKIAGFGLALMFYEVKDLLPPLATYIRETFSILWDQMGTGLELSLKKVMNNFVADAMSAFGLNFVSRMFSKSIEDVKNDANKALDDTAALAKRNTEALLRSVKYKPVPTPDLTGTTEGGRRLREDPRDIWDKSGLENNQTFKAAWDLIHAQQEVLDRSRLKNLAAIFGIDWPVTKSALSTAEQNAFDAGNKWGTKFGEGIKHSKLENALVGSAEAMARIIEYRDAIATPIGQNGLQTSVQSSPVTQSSDQPIESQLQKQTVLLENIRKLIAEQGGKPGDPVLRTANLKGGNH
jgi:hypothetical protein